MSVADTGTGMSEEVRQRAFEPFYTSKPGGLGLGLSTSLDIVRANGGELWATAIEAGFGPTTFQFTLPTALSAR